MLRIFGNTFTATMPGNLPPVVIAVLRRWWEPVLFLVLTGLHLLPVHAGRWFVTLDGPCHLYSARLLRALWQGDAFIGGFFRVNPWPDPYWLGHLLMAPLHGMVPAWALERLLYSLAVAALALSFRWFIGVLAPDRRWMSLAVMPFLLHYALRLGFLNFSLSLPLLLVALNLGVRATNDAGGNWRPLAVVLVLLYFAHLTSLLVACALLLAFACWRSLIAEGPVGPRIKAALSWWPALVLPAALTLLYAVRQPEASGVVRHLPPAELWNALLQGRSWNALWAGGELEASQWTALPLLLGGVLAAVWGLGEALRNGARALPFWSVAWLPALAAYLLLPDTMAGGSSASPRLLLFLMLLMAVALATSALPRWIAGPLLVCTLAADLHHTRIQYLSARSLSQEADVFLGVAGGLEDGTTLLSLNYSSNWMHSNLPNYLGVHEARVVVLDHFTALAPFNPVQWRPERLPYHAIGDFAESGRPCVRMNGYEAVTGVPVHAVVTWKMGADIADSCAVDVRRQLGSGYRLKSSGAHGDAVLYELK
jgi:hypothetical protein